MRDGPVGTARFALYWAPDLDDPLHAAGSHWLGRDAETGALLPQPDIPGIAELTADARQYGLHATLKPPFRLACSFAELRAAVAAFAATQPPCALPPLAMTDLDGFLALCPTAPSPALHALCDAAVAALDPCRAPPDAAELARRRAAGLTPRQKALLDRWGYPYVFEEWRFHVTLTRRLTAVEQSRVRPAAVALLGDAAGAARVAGSLTLFAQPRLDAPFLVAERFALGG